MIGFTAFDVMIHSILHYSLFFRISSLFNGKTLSISALVKTNAKTINPTMNAKIEIAVGKGKKAGLLQLLTSCDSVSIAKPPPDHMSVIAGNGIESMKPIKRFILFNQKYSSVLIMFPLIYVNPNERK